MGGPSLSTSPVANAMVLRVVTRNGLPGRHHDRCGFGLPTTVPSWGGMLSREGREYMEIAPRLAVWSGLCLTVVVYCLNIVGDAVRDLLDPRLRGSSGRLGAYGAQAVSKAALPAQPVRKL